MLKDWNGALKNYNKALKYNPDNALLHYNKAMIYLKLNDHKNAIPSFDLAIKHDPSDN
jgi:tetratricopeptide (TPR) repeat protein